MYQTSLEEFIGIEDTTAARDYDYESALLYFRAKCNGIETVEDRDVSYLLKPYTRVISDDDIQF